MKDNYIKELTFDSPIKYKNLVLYPVTVKNLFELSGYAECLKVDRNDMTDIKEISMTDLEYLFYKSTLDEGIPYIYMLDRLLSIVLKEDGSFENILFSLDRYKYDEYKKPFMVINGEKYDSRDFKEIKYIISMQNEIELPDETMSKEVRDSIKKARDFISRTKSKGNKPASLEDYFISVSVATGWSLDYVYSLPIRKFYKILSRIDNLIHYKIYLSASMSGMVEFKDKSFIKHWLSNLDTDRYADVSVSMETVENRLSTEGAMEREKSLKKY